MSAVVGARGLLDPISAIPGLQRMPPGLRASAARALGLARIVDEVDRIGPVAGPLDFAEKGLRQLQVTVDVAARDVDRIPASGPTIVAANHPFGGVEGLALAAVLGRIRPDLRILGNGLLSALAPLAEWIIPVDPFDRPGAPRGNAAGVRKALEWVRSGGVLLVFPAGEVSHLAWGRAGVCDPHWRSTAAGLARRTKAMTVPAFVAGRQGALFQVAGLVHPLLRTVMLPRLMLNGRARRLDLRIGEPVEAARLAAFGDDEAATAYLRERTYNLARRATFRAKPTDALARPPQAVAPAVPAAETVREVALLPPEQVLVTSGDFDVFWARAPQIPRLLAEIGRLREETFRAAGEGTGAAIDLDGFDEHYLHLAVWNRATSEVVGAYRLGPTDEILPVHGVGGLYTSTLFSFRPALLARLGPALEMGRSFVRESYQRSWAGLVLLWRGIGEFVVRHPRYRRLFGPVSVSNEYSAASRELLASYLMATGADGAWRRLVRPRTPLRPRRRGAPGMRVEELGVDDIAAMVDDLEAVPRGVPVLVRQYLRLGGRVLAVNVDPAFSNVVDGFIVVDLAETERRSLDRYMGRDGAAHFLAHHIPPAPEQGRCRGLGLPAPTVP